MIAADTSVVVAAFASWHEGHESALRVLERRPRLPVHVVAETYSVLTRLPPPHRTSFEVAAQFIALRFQNPFLHLSDDGLRSTLGTAATARIGGGAIYDALIAATAAEAGAVLLTRDRRAVGVYETLGTQYDLLL